MTNNQAQTQDDLSFEIEKRQTLPRGSYKVGLEGLEKKTSEHGDYLLWTFGSELRGKPVTLTGVSSMKTSTKTKFFEWASALIGRDLAAGEKLKSSDLIGRSALAIVSIEEKGADKFNRIDALTVIDDGDDSPDLSDSFEPDCDGDVQP